jgi:argininosuccinate synthase
LKKIITACLGSADELAHIKSLSASGAIEVIAVAFDLANGHNLRALHDDAIAAGAARCHVLGVKEAFARECVLPSIQGEATVDQLAIRFVANTLAKIAELEGGADVSFNPQTTPLMGGARSTRRVPPDRPARIEIAFENGVPLSLNGVTMTLAEMIECLSTIAAAQGIGDARAAVHALQVARRGVAVQDAATGSAWLEMADGRMRTLQLDCATT